MFAMDRWPRERVLSLAPDRASVQAATALAGTRAWLDVGTDSKPSGDPVLAAVVGSTRQLSISVRPRRTPAAARAGRCRASTHSPCSFSGVMAGAQQQPAAFRDGLVERTGGADDTSGAGECRAAAR